VNVACGRYIQAVPGGNVAVENAVSVQILDGLGDLQSHVDQLLCVQRLHSTSQHTTHTHTDTMPPCHRPWPVLPHVFMMYTTHTPI